MKRRKIGAAIKRGGMSALALFSFILISQTMALCQNTAATRRLINDAAAIAALALAEAQAQQSAVARTPAWAEHSLKVLANTLRPPQKVPVGEPLELVFGAPGPFYHVTVQTALLSIGELRRNQNLLPGQRAAGFPLPEDVLSALGRIWLKQDVQLKVRWQADASRSAMRDFLGRRHLAPPPFDPNGFLGPLPLAASPESLGIAALPRDVSVSRVRTAAFQQPAPGDYFTPFVYTVYFENLDAAAARVLGKRAGGPAQKVDIANSLAAIQDGRTVQNVNLSFHHPSRTDLLSMTPFGLQSGIPYALGSTPVRLTFQNTQSRLTWVFAGSSATLPEGGRGSVSYQIQPVGSRRDAAAVENPGAAILFASQMPFMTNRWIP